MSWALIRWFGIPFWAGCALVSLWIAKDLAAFSSMRRLYEPESAEPRIVGDVGVAVTDLKPSGFVRVYGELWQAEAASGAYISEDPAYAYATFGACCSSWRCCRTPK